MRCEMAATHFLVSACSDGRSVHDIAVSCSVSNCDSDSDSGSKSNS
jgi:hypothetical protein